MQTHGYERSTPWRQSLALLDHIESLTATFENDTLGFAGKLRGSAADLPVQCAICFEQPTYEGVAQHAESINAQLFRLVLNAQVAVHRGVMTGKQLKALRIAIAKLEESLNALPDELFEDEPQAAA